MSLTHFLASSSIQSTESAGLNGDPDSRTATVVDTIVHYTGTHIASTTGNYTAASSESRAVDLAPCR
jgi:hypothetical protein